MTWGKYISFASDITKLAWNCCPCRSAVWFICLYDSPGFGKVRMKWVIANREIICSGNLWDSGSIDERKKAFQFHSVCSQFWDVMQSGLWHSVLRLQLKPKLNVLIFKTYCEVNDFIIRKTKFVARLLLVLDYWRKILPHLQGRSENPRTPECFWVELSISEWYTFSLVSFLCIR